MFAKFFNLMLVWSLGVICSLKNAFSHAERKACTSLKELERAQALCSDA